jgi:3-hydroxyacyl-[acyl-carrier-protein] dehydratase
VSALDPVALGLPHREPFVFVDAIVSIEPAKRVVGEKTFSANDPIFRGHFPGDPIVPGVLLTEALAQASGVLAGQSGRALRLAAIKSMKFPGAAKPDEKITLVAEKSGTVGGLWQFQVAARVEDRVVAEGAIVLSEPPAA